MRLRAPERTPLNRKGLTLVEVLIAILVMGIGLISLLALFPLGALNMAQAIKDNRMAQIASSDRGFANFRIRNAGFVDPTLNSAFQYFEGPPPPGPEVPPATTGPSYPVYVDPFGWQVQPNATVTDLRVGTWAGNAQPTVIKRIKLSSIDATATAPAQIPRFFSLLDEMAYGPDGTPNPPGANPPGPGSIERNGRYTWGYLCQEAQYIPVGSTTHPLVNVTAVVYDRRALQLVNTTQLAGENVYTGATYNQGSTIVTLTWNQTQQPEPPPIHPGTWILDASANTTDTTSPPGIHAYFYRVVSVSNPGSGGTGTIDYEISAPAQGSTTAATGILVVLEGVAEIFPFGQG
jgi:prepilin-type N-terminal cleavage/methylation domain-containing protein